MIRRPARDSLRIFSAPETEMVVWLSKMRALYAGPSAARMPFRTVAWDG
jgi:hypothetical protein